MSILNFDDSNRIICRYPQNPSNDLNPRKRFLNKNIFRRFRPEAAQLSGFAVVIALSACGGGGGESTAGSGSATPPSNNSFTAWTPTAAVLAAKKVNSALVFTASDTALAAGQGCANTITNKTVYEQANTVVFAAAGVTEVDQQEVTDYAEAAVMEIRSTFPGAATVGFSSNKKVYVCVQTETFNNSGNPAAASPVTYPDWAGLIVLTSPSSSFSKAARSAIIASNLKSAQDNYRRTLAHEMMHLMESFRGGPPLEQWLTEGIARYFEFGKTARPKDEILALIAAQNPVSLAWPAYDTRAQLTSDGYDAAASVMAYLFSPTGANNTYATHLAFLDKLKADSALYLQSCLTIPAPATCSPSEYEIRRDAFVIAAFEATYKEKDGSPMKLRTGSNNLQDTVATRISAWW